MKNMADENFGDLTAVQIDLGLRFFNLLTGRVLKKAYLKFDEKTKEAMNAVFPLGSDKEKNKFIQDYIPNFKKLFEEEAEKIEEEVKKEIEKRII